MAFVLLSSSSSSLTIPLSSAIDQLDNLNLHIAASAMSLLQFSFIMKSYRYIACPRVDIWNGGEGGVLRHCLLNSAIKGA